MVMTLTGGNSHVCLSDKIQIPIVSQDNLFLLPCEAISESNSASSGPSLDLWHNRLRKFSLCPDLLKMYVIRSPVIMIL